MAGKKKCKSHGFDKTYVEIVRFIFTNSGQYLCTLKCVKCGAEFEGTMEKTK